MGKSLSINTVALKLIHYSLYIDTIDMEKRYHWKIQPNISNFGHCVSFHAFQFVGKSLLLSYFFLFRYSGGGSSIF